MKKQTGLYCKMDDLGRILIPKEIRYQLKIRTGDKMNISVDEETSEVIFATDHTWETLYQREVRTMVTALRRQFPELAVVELYQGYGEYYNPILRGYLEGSLDVKSEAIKKLIDKAADVRRPVYDDEACVVAIPVVYDKREPTKGAFVGVWKTPCNSKDVLVRGFVAAAQTSAQYLKLLEQS